MTKKTLLQIVLGEFEAGQQTAWRLLYSDIVQFLWNKGFSGATVIRAEEGLDEEDHIRTMILEDVQFNNLPIMIETIETSEKIESVLSDLKSQVSHGEIATMKVIDMMGEEDLDVNEHEFFMLKIYVKEASKWRGRALYEEIIELLRDHELIWSTVTRGIEGFGKDHVIHRQKIFALSSQVPIVIESVGKTEIIQKLIPQLRERVQEGMIIAIPAQVVLDR